MSSKIRVSEAAEEAVLECLTAMKHHAPFHSPHEGYAVILEELEEAWDDIKANRPAYDEMVQVAAMALRYLVEIK